MVHGRCQYEQLRKVAVGGREFLIRNVDQSQQGESLTNLLLTNRVASIDQDPQFVQPTEFTGNLDEINGGRYQVATGKDSISSGSFRRFDPRRVFWVVATGRRI